MSLLTILLLALLHPTGFAILTLFKLQSAVTFAASWMVGAFLSTAFFFLLLASGVSTPLSFWIVLLPIVFLSLLALVRFEYRQAWIHWLETIWPDTKMYKILLGTIIVLLGFILCMNAFWPHTDWDAMTLYDFRAKVVMNLGSLSPMLRSIQDVYWISYPWFTSSLFVFAYLTGSSNIMGVFTFLVLSLLASFFTILSSGGRFKARGYFACLALLTMPLVFSHAMVAYTNFPFMIYWGLGIILMLSWIQTGRDEDGLLGSLLFGASSWVRASEPFWIVGVMVLVVGILVTKKAYAAFWLSLLLLPKILWKYFVGQALIQILPTDSKELAVFQNGSGTKLSMILGFLDFEKWQQVALHFVRFAGPVWGTWAILIIILMLSKRWTVREIVPVGVVGICMSLILVGTFLFTANPYWNQIIDSFQRLLMFLLPVFVYVIFSARKNYEDS